MTLALTSGLGVLLVGTALFFVVGRILGELGIVGNRVPAHQAVRYSFFTSRKPAPFIALAAIPLIFAICRARLADIHRANTTAAVSTFLLLALAVLPWLTPAAAALWCLPAVMFALQSNSPAVLYIAAALQLATGAWLLLMFRARKCNDEPAPA